MRRRTRGGRTPLYAEVNVVSLIDVMMLLLVIFMITAPIMQGGVDVTLPKAQATPLESKGGLVISITKDGRIFANDLPLRLGEFRASFRSLALKSGKDGVYVRADESVNYGLVVQVLAIIHAAGVNNVGLVATPEAVVK